MAKQDWKEDKRTHEVAEWKHNKKDVSLVVGSAGQGNYEVELKKYSPSTGTYRDVLKSFKSKPQAIAYANVYMRTN